MNNNDTVLDDILSSYIVANNGLENATDFIKQFIRNKVYSEYLNKCKKLFKQRNVENWNNINKYMLESLFIKLLNSDIEFVMSKSINYWVEDVLNEVKLKEMIV